MTGENPHKLSGEPYGRIFVQATIGPRVPNPYTLPRVYADQLAALVEMSPPRDVMGRSIDSMATPYALIHELRQLDPDDRGLLTAARRYESARAFRDLILVAQDRDPYPWFGRHSVHPDNLASWVANVADACTEDGADRGFIPLIAGESRAVWEALYAWLAAREGRDRHLAPLHRSIGGF